MLRPNESVRCPIKKIFNLIYMASSGEANLRSIVFSRSGALVDGLLGSMCVRFGGTGGTQTLKINKRIEKPYNKSKPTDSKELAIRQVHRRQLNKLCI